MNRPLSATRAPSRPKPAEGGPNEVDLHDQPSRGTGQVSFSGHETFTLRHGWLKKAVEAVAADAQIFSNDDAMVALGVGKIWFAERFGIGRLRRTRLKKSPEPAVRTYE